MKFYLKHPSGWEVSFQRESMEREKFYALVALAAGALFVLMVLGCVLIRWG